MIERWLQITCDNEDCGDTDYSVLPNMTVAEFLADSSLPWRRVGKYHACCAACADAIRTARRK